MAIGRGAVIRQADTLFRVGTFGAIPDGQLLERFVDRHDGGEAAFEALVARHGPMVLGVCRQILPSPHDADDAFQATFLVLVRRASAIRKRESLGPWLHGVARRIALRSKTNAARRRQREGEQRFRIVGGFGSSQELAGSLHDEIDRLPEKYRSPIVLCDLEGHTHAEAAERLKWPIGTVSGRLSRARDLLRGRIARRGLALSTASLASMVLNKSARAAVPSGLVRSTARAASSALTSMSVGSIKLLLLAPIAASLLVTAGALGLFAGETRGPKSSTAIVPQQHLIASSSHELTTTEPRTRRAPEAKSPPDPIEITSLARSADGRLLAAGCRNAMITVWDLDTGLETATLTGHSAPIYSLAFLGSGRTLASSADDHLVTLWDVSTGQPMVSAFCPQAEHPLVLGPGPQRPDRGGLGRG
jgi:RNA polymerase sigma factor (sigma-70 family)